MDKEINGFIKLDRAIFKHWIFQDAEKFKAFIDLIQLMRFKEEKLNIGNEIVIIPRGSCYTSELKLGERWGWSRKRVRSFLGLLEGEGMVQRKGTTKGTTLSLVNYSFYQGDGPTKGTSKEHQKNNERPAREHQKNNEGYTKEERKEREERNKGKEGEEGEEVFTPLQPHFKSIYHEEIYKHVTLNTFITFFQDFEIKENGDSLEVYVSAFMVDVIKNKYKPFLEKSLGKKILIKEVEQ